MKQRHRARQEQRKFFSWIWDDTAEATDTKSNMVAAIQMHSGI